MDEDRHKNAILKRSGGSENAIFQKLPIQPTKEKWFCTTFIAKAPVTWKLSPHIRLLQTMVLATLPGHRKRKNPRKHQVAAPGREAVPGSSAGTYPSNPGNDGHIVDKHSPVPALPHAPYKRRNPGNRTA